MIETHLMGHLEALLFAAGTPLSPDKIASALEMTPQEVAELADALSEEYAKEGRGLRIRRVAGGLQLTTKPELFTTIQKLIAQQEIKLSNAAMETLAIIAFKQPVTRSEMEAIRGVKVDGVVNNLLELNLITEVGRKDAIGHPILYGTTDLFLVTFGLDSLHDLPEIPEEILAPKTEEIQEGALFTGDGKVIESAVAKEHKAVENEENIVLEEIDSPADSSTVEEVLTEAVTDEDEEVKPES